MLGKDLLVSSVNGGLGIYRIKEDTDVMRWQDIDMIVNTLISCREVLLGRAPFQRSYKEYVSSLRYMIRF